MRISVVTPFPLKTEPGRGISIYNHLLYMKAWAELKIYVPHPRYPGWRFLQPRTFLYQREEFAVPTPGLEPEFLEYPAFPVLTRPANGFLLSSKLIERFRTWKPDIVLSYCAYPDACAAVVAARKLGVPVITGCLGSDIRRISDPLTKQMVRYTMRNADYVLGVSKELITRAIALGASPERTRPIPNGCSSDIFYPADRVQARRQLAINPDARLIVFTGRLVELKGVQELLPAFFRMAAHDPQLELACVGDGPLLNRYQTEAAQAGLTERIHFLGNQPHDRVALWLAASNLFCLPSHSEGCPNAVIEALACGRPVVATDVGGIPDLVDSSSGLLVPPRNSAALETALTHALARTWDEQRIAQGCCRTWQNMAEETFEVCQLVYDRASEQDSRRIQALL